MRLSNFTGDYNLTGTIIDKNQFTAVGGEGIALLNFIDGSEEVYKNGKRLSKGPAQEYTTEKGKIRFAVPLANGDKMILIGRSSTNELPFTKGNSESITLEDGQMNISFRSISTEAIEVYIGGVLAVKGRLTAPQDFVVESDSSIRLTSSYPAGTVLDGVQGGRLAWVDPNNLMVSDGVTTKSLSNRFSNTQESVPFFIQTNGVQLHELTVGLIIQRWSIKSDSGIPELDEAGTYPVLRVGKSYWNPPSISATSGYKVVSWVETDTALNISAIDTSTGANSIITYGRRSIANRSSDNSRMLGGHDVSYFTNASNLNAGRISDDLLPSSSILRKGIVQLCNDPKSKADDKAATISVVNRVMEEISSMQDTISKSDNSTTLEGYRASYFTNASNIADGILSTNVIPKGSIASPGIIQLSNDITSSSNMYGATIGSIKSTVDTFDGKIHNISDVIAKVSERVSTNNDNINAVNNKVTSTEGRIKEVSDSLAKSIESQASAGKALDAKVANAEARIKEVSDSLAKSIESHASAGKALDTKVDKNCYASGTIAGLVKMRLDGTTLYISTTDKDA